MNEPNTMVDLEKGTLTHDSPTSTFCDTPQAIMADSKTTTLQLPSSKPSRNRSRVWLPHKKKADSFTIRVRKLESHVRGYPNLAAFLDSDEGFKIYRRFGWLQSRLLLDKQEELRLLEKKLENLDKQEATTREGIPMTRDAPPPNRTPRRDILRRIEHTFFAYVKLLGAAQQMSALNPPSEADYCSLRHYMLNFQPLVSSEGAWVEWKEDLVTLRPGRERAWIDVAIERALRFFHGPFIEAIFCPRIDQRKSASPDVVYYMRSRINQLAVVLITLLVLVLLVIPIYILYHLVTVVGGQHAYITSIVVLLVFTLTFSSVLSLFTRAQRHEILAAAAAYCAVLVVFLGNVSKS